ncbi:1a protein [Alcea rosea virus 1]|nr:1a protein [Alcea rosea virus 1]
MALAVFAVPVFTIGNLELPEVSFTFSAFGVVPTGACRAFDLPACYSADSDGTIVPVPAFGDGVRACPLLKASVASKVPFSVNRSRTPSHRASINKVVISSPVISDTSPNRVLYVKVDGTIKDSPSKCPVRRNVTIGGPHGFDVTRQFHDRKHSKTMIINPSNGDRIIVDRCVLSLNRGAIITGVTHDGGVYLLRSTPFSRKTFFRKGRIGEAPLRSRVKSTFVQQKNHVNVLPIDDICTYISPKVLAADLVTIQFGTAEPIIINSRTSQFIPFTAGQCDVVSTIGHPASEVRVSAETKPLSVSARPLSGVISLPKRKLKSLFELVDNEPLAIRGKIGLHYRHLSSFDEFKLSIEDYLSFYNPFDNDFFSSFECGGVCYNALPCSNDRVIIRRVGDGVVIARLPASRDYLSMYRMHLEKKFAGPLARRFSASRGFCYLNHLWYLCLISGHSFSSARGAFLKLGKYPRFSDFIATVGRYFSFPATRVGLMGYFSAASTFHCDNFKGRVHWGSYRRLRFSRIGGETEGANEDLPNVVSPLEKERMIAQLIDTARGHKDSLLLKKLEVDLVDHISRLKRSQSDKPERRVPFHLTEQQQTVLVRDYPQYDLLFTHSSHSDHPMAAASRFLENSCLVDKCGDNVSDIGGCPLYHYHNSKMKRVHVCRPVLDSKDAQRRVIRNFEFKKSGRGSSKEPESNVYVNSLHSSCSLTVSECTHETPSMMMVQVYDIPLRELCGAMIKKNASVCHITMVTPGEILDKRECFHHDLLGCDISIDIHGDSITYKFGASCYTHDLSVILSYMTTPVLLLGNHLFSVEMVEVRCGVNYYVVTRSDVCPAMDCEKTIRFQRCCLDLVKVKLPRFCKKSRKCLPGVDLIYVDRKFVERVYEYVVGNCSVINSKTFEWTWNFVKSSKSRVVISGKIIHRDVSINLENLEQFVVVMLAAGVRSRVASEYLAKNISMFAGDASFCEIVGFTISEKLKDIKRQMNKFVCDTFRKMFADSLLMEFLDIDDSLEYLDVYSELTVRIRTSGFGAIPVNEPEIMLADRSTRDTTDALIQERVRELYNPPHVKRAVDGKQRSGGLYGGSNMTSPQLFEIVRTALGKVCLSSSTFYRQMLLKLLDIVYGGKAFSLLRRVFAFIRSVSSYLSTDELTNLIGKAIECFSAKTRRTACFFYELYLACSSKGVSSLSNFVTLCSELSSKLVAFGGSFKLYFEPLLEFFKLVKDWSFFEGQQALPFESCAIVLKRMIYDLKRYACGELTKSQLFNRILFDMIFEHSLNSLIALKIGVADTLLKDMFIRTVSSLVADGVLDGYDMTLFSFVKLTALIPMFVRKLIVSFFDDDLCEYVGIVKHGVSDLSATEYIARLFVHNVQGHLMHCNEWIIDLISTIREKTDESLNYLLARVDEYISERVSAAVSKTLDGLRGRVTDNTVFKTTANSYRKVSRVVKKVYGFSKRFSALDEDSDVYYSADSDCESSYRGGLRGGGIPSVLSSVIRISGSTMRVVWRFLVREVKYLMGTIVQDFSLSTMISSLYQFRRELLRCRALREVPVIGAVENFGAMLWAQVFEFGMVIGPTYSASGVAGVLRVCLGRVAEDCHSSEFLFFELPLYLLDFYLHSGHPLTLALKIISKMIVFSFGESYACKLVVVGKTRPDVFVHIEEESTPSARSEQEIEELLDDDFGSRSFSDLSYFESRERIVSGLRGGGHPCSILSLFLRALAWLMRRLCRMSLLRFFFSFSLSSFLSSIVGNEQAGVVSKAIAFLLLLRDPKLASIRLLKVFSQLRSARRSRVFKSLFSYMLKVEELFTRLLYGEPTVQGNQQLFRRVAVSAREATCVSRGEIITSYENIAELRHDLDATFKNFLPTPDRADTREDGGLEVEFPRVAECDVPKCSEEIERADLTPYVADILENAEDAARSSNEVVRPVRKMRNSSKCCKFLNLQNISSTVPSLSSGSLGTFRKCTLAIRELYYAQEMVIFSVHSKLLSYYEELEVVDFDRRLAGCHQDVDLLVYDPSKGAAVNHESRLVKRGTFAGHQFFFSRNGLRPYDCKMQLNQPALFHAQTKFLAANEFLASCESHSTLTFKNLDVEIKLFEAPPGGGKTTSLIELYLERRVNFKTFIVTANKNSQVEITERVSKLIDSDSPAFDKKSVMTMDSYLMNRCGDTCDILFVDECFMVHAGEVLAIINKTMCKVAILFGDSKQIHYIERDELVSTIYHDIDGFIQDFCRVYGEVSYRCPWDVCEWLSKVYDRRIASNNRESVGRSSVRIAPIESVDDVPYAEGAKYLTYTQSEKSDISRRFSREKKRVDVSTVHEAQGETFKRVILVRSKFQEDAPFVSLNHIVVALSRHVESLCYHVLSSRVYDDTSAAINTMLDIAEKFRTMPRSFETSSISVDIVGEYPDDSRCKALSSPLDSINSFLNDVLPGSNTINFGDLSAEMSSQPFDSGVDGIVIRDAGNEKVYDDHTNQRV